MKFVNISGPRSDIDRVMDLYLSRYEIQLESALSELKTVDNLRPFVEMNPYRDALLKAVQFVGFLEDPDKTLPDTKMGLNDIFELIRTTNEEYLKLQSQQDQWKKKKEEIAARQKVIEPFRPMGGDLGKILNYKYIAYRFGKMPGGAVPEAGEISPERSGCGLCKRSAGRDICLWCLFCRTCGSSEDGCGIPFTSF